MLTGFSGATAREDMINQLMTNIAVRERLCLEKMALGRRKVQAERSGRTGPGMEVSWREGLLARIRETV